jgi:hypothetical protein
VTLLQNYRAETCDTEVDIKSMYVVNWSHVLSLVHHKQHGQAAVEDPIRALSRHPDGREISIAVRLVPIDLLSLSTVGCLRT